MHQRGSLIHRLFFIACLLIPTITTIASTPVISFDTLLHEMLDRKSLAEFPAPAYTCKQFSSYDRRSTGPDNHETWFANGDCGRYLRVETRNDHEEFVMMDAEGPGAVVRIWSANPQGTLRIYLDGAEQPVIEMPMQEALGGTGVIGSPLSATRSRGWNLYLPIPYENRCIITSDKGDFYYQINYRTYEPDTKVQSFAWDDLEKHHDLIKTVQHELAEPPHPSGDMEVFTASVIPGKESVIWEWDVAVENRKKQIDGNQAITELILRCPGMITDEMLRSTILTATFDGEQTIECPIGDFFGAAPGINPYTSWWCTVNEDGTMACRWVMPFEQTAVLKLRNTGKLPVTLTGSVCSTPYQWTDRSMHFHTGWRIEKDIPTRPMKDWNYIEMLGQGVFVGDMLAVTNPVKNWWGEGDEKIYIDGEPFPSHFGTGTEDYYGYAWCCNEPFEGPFHNQPRCDGPGNYGHTSVNRFRLLDGIPFTRSFKFDMEVWHWAECNVTYAATTYWYAKPGTMDNHVAIEPDMVQTIPQAPPLPPPLVIKGAVEGESLTVLDHTKDREIGPQQLWKEQVFSGNAHLWVQTTEVGDFIEVEVPVKQPGRNRVLVYMVKSWDYGIVQCSVNGHKAGQPIDTFNTEARDITSTGPIELGDFDLKETCILRIEVVGSNKKSEGSKHFFGLDAVICEPIE